MSDRRTKIGRMLNDVFIHVFDDEGIQIHEEMTAADVDEWDSLSHITLIVAVESRFGIKFRASEIESLKNVGEMIDLIDAKVSEENLKT